MKNLTELSRKIFQAAKVKGFWDEPRDLGEVFMLIISEAGEAMEAHRKGKFADMETFNMVIDNDSLKELNDNKPFYRALFIGTFRENIKDSFPDEIADIAIRCLDFAGSRDIDINAVCHTDFVAPNFATKSDNVGMQLLRITDLIVSSFNYFEDSDGYYGEVALCNAIEACYAVAEKNGIDLDRHIELKLLYNQTRPWKHGKNY